MGSLKTQNTLALFTGLTLHIYKKKHVQNIDTAHVTCMMLLNALHSKTLIQDEDTLSHCQYGLSSEDALLTPCGKAGYYLFTV